MDIKIIVATHKKYNMPTDEIYIPLHVGAINKEDLGYLKDDSASDNISIKNPYYCELTGLYFANKNLHADYLGLVHYRRYFKGNNHSKNKFDNIISKAELEKVLKDNDIILPTKRHYYIETNKSQYLHAHHPEGFNATYDVIKELYPDYIPSFDKMMNKRSGHKFNMFIMKEDKFNSYCDWLFSILFEVEKRIDISTWNKSEQRVYGYLSERLLDVWLDKNNYKYIELPYMFMEKQNWFKKGFNFIKRKFIKNEN